VIDPIRDAEVYRPGDKVPASGIYLVVHSKHRIHHETIAIRGEEFPACRTCKSDVSFCLTREVPHVTHDFDLSGPRLRLLRCRAKAANATDD
jgi:hypothetical protein